VDAEVIEMEKLIVQHEKLIEESLLSNLKERPEALEIKHSSSGARNLADLLGGHKPTIFHDTNEWNPYPKCMQDLIGAMTPDIVLRSPVSGQNRMIIEVKDSEPLGYGVEDSQIIRYFLHLLASTTKVPEKGATDIRRAVLLCAPSVWFRNAGNAKTWNHFMEHFSGLAKAFDITLGELHADAF
jgi:hypothetical protein